MKPALELDTRGWQQAAVNLFKTELTKSVADFINGQAFKVALWAMKFTEKANRREIERFLLSRVDKETRRSGEEGARGWVRIKRTVYDATVARRLLGAYFRKHGEWPVRGVTEEERVRRLVAVKVKSAGMMRAGWINAINALRRVIYRVPAGVPNKKSFGDGSRLGGYAIPAKFRLASNIEATIANEAPGYQRTKRVEKAWTGELGDPMPVLVKGLQTALNLAQADMERKLAQRLKRDLNRFGVK